MSDDWKALFAQALKLIKDVEKNAGPFEWSFGGGTALMLQDGHRESRDIDIFLKNVQLLPYFSPRTNDVAEQISRDYEEDSRYIKLALPDEKGEIDFIAAPYITANPFFQKTIDGQSVKIETPEEIIGKKVFYRTETFLVRDVFDLVVFLHLHKDRFLENAGLFSPKKETLKKRIDLLFKKSGYERTVSGYVKPLPNGVLFAKQEAFAHAMDILDSLKPLRITFKSGLKTKNRP